MATPKKKRLRQSIFVDVPPYHVFIPPTQQYLDPPCKGLQEEEWQFPAQVMPVVRDTVAHAGFKVTKGLLRSSDEDEIIEQGNIWDNLPLVEKHIDAIDFTRLRSAVKINKFPAFIDLNRKDLLWKNFRRMQMIYGKEAFGFHPPTFYIPKEQKQLYERMKADDYKSIYIVKLPNNFCGIGACVIKHPSQIPSKKKVHQENNKKIVKEDPIIVQKYLTNPYLINGYKFDFRIYVLITSIAPLRIYLYKDGLVRFATEKFSVEDEDLANIFIHLTNFTVNKAGKLDCDFPPGCQANKWTIYELWEYLKERGKNPDIFWQEVKDVVIKTVLCAHEKIAKTVEEKSNSFYNNFNLLGIDIFIDEDMKPYLLEVNTIPSLFINAISKEIDTYLKSNIVAEVFNICGHHISSSTGVKYKQEIIDAHLPGSSTRNIGFDHRLYVKTPTDDDKKKQEKIMKDYLAKTGHVNIMESNNKDDLPDLYAEKRDKTPDKSTTNIESKILEDLTPLDVRVLVHSEDELTQTETFERIFPTSETRDYLTYMNTPSYYDLLLASWEERYADSPGEGLLRLHEECLTGKHLIVPDSEKKIKANFKPIWTPPKKAWNLPHIFKNK